MDHPTVILLTLAVEVSGTTATREKVAEMTGTRRSRTTIIRASRLGMRDQLTTSSIRTTSRMSVRETDHQLPVPQMNPSRLPPILLRARRSGAKSDF